MRILVDTSVWVDFLNDHPSPEANALAALIANRADLATCGVIVAEVLQGLRRESERRAVEARFRDLVFLEATGFDLYQRAAELFRALRARGKTIRSTIDCVIAVVASEHQCYVLAKDRDMTTLLTSGLIAAQPWRP